MQCVAHGADTIVFFRWRSCPMGTEQYWHGILPHSGRPGRYYREIRGLLETYSPLLREIQGALPKAEVAILRSYDQERAIGIQPHHPDHRYIQHLMTYYKALHRANIPVDFVGEQHDWAKYKVLIAPLQFLMTESHLDMLRAYVENGGRLVVTWRSGIKDDSNLCHTDGPVPVRFNALTGVNLLEYDCLRDCAGSVRWDGVDYKCTQWCDVLHATTAEPVAEYAHEFYAGTPAITRNRYGQGLTWYVGTTMSDALADKFIGEICREADIAPLMATPHGVEAVHREKDGKTYLFLLNHNESVQQADVPAGYTPWDGGAWMGEIGPLGVSVFVKE
jgi:beta-galactosidase